MFGCCVWVFVCFVRPSQWRRRYLTTWALARVEIILLSWLETELQSPSNNNKAADIATEHCMEHCVFVCVCITFVLWIGWHMMVPGPWTIISEAEGPNTNLCKYSRYIQCANFNCFIQCQCPPPRRRCDMLNYHWCCRHCCCCCHCFYFCFFAGTLCVWRVWMADKQAIIENGFRNTTTASRAIETAAAAAIRRRQTLWNVRALALYDGRAGLAQCKNLARGAHHF